MEGAASRPAIEPGLVSTVIPVHNRGALLRQAVGSVLAQSYRPLEIIIVDDGSTDDTPDAARALVREHEGEIRLIEQRNGGVGAARETGRLAARGEFLQYLDSDDVLLPGKFASQVALLRADTSCDVAYGRTRYRLADGTLEARPHKSIERPLPAILPAFLVCRWWETATPLYRRTITDAAGPWLPLSNEEDWEYDCRIGALEPRLCFVDEVVAEHRDHGGNRLSRGENRDPRRMRNRAQAHVAVARHAHRAGIPHDAPEMRHFARALFLLCRQTGAAGLAEEAKSLLAAAESAAAADPALGRQLRIYRRIAGSVGWVTLGRLADLADRTREARR